MTFVEVKGLPERRAKKSVITFLNEFMSTNVKFVEVKLEKGEYKSVSSALSSFIKTIKTQAYPINARMINNKLYLERKDI